MLIRVQQAITTHAKNVLDVYASVGHRRQDALKPLPRLQHAEVHAERKVERHELPETVGVEAERGGGGRRGWVQRSGGRQAGGHIGAFEVHREVDAAGLRERERAGGWG